MLALRKENKKTLLKNINLKSIKNGEIKIKILKAGICRTDVYVYEDIIKNDNLTLGHECCGKVVETKSNKFKEGDYVTINPVLKNKSMIGIEYDGCFSEFLVINEEQAFKIPNSFNTNLGAYIEPITASLSPLKSKILKKDMLILIMGKGRIAQLTKLILNITGYKNIDLYEEKQNIKYECVIETGATSELINKVPEILVENGLFIIKSRNPENYNINFYNFVKKNIIIESLYYYDYEKTIDIVKDNKNCFDFLFGNEYSLKDWKKAFNDSENKKSFINLG